MNELRTRLLANRFRLAYPHSLAFLQGLRSTVRASEPDWFVVAQALEEAEPGGRRPRDFAWHTEASLRPDDGNPQHHLITAREFAAGSPRWLMQIPLPAHTAGLGRRQDGLVLIETAELLQLLPDLFTSDAPTVWARTWPNLQDAAMDFDQLDPLCDGASGYFIELFKGTPVGRPTDPPPPPPEPFKIV